VPNGRLAGSERATRGCSLRQVRRDFAVQLADLGEVTIVGTTLTGTVSDTVDVGGRPAVVPQVTGMTYRTGEHTFSIDPHDPLVPGFLLR